MEFLNNLLGLEANRIEPFQMAARAFIVFFLSLGMIRIAGIRVFGRHSAFDTLTSLMLGAIMGRAIVADQSFFGSILATLVLVLLHRLMAWITFHNKKIGAIFKGQNILLIKDGRQNNKNLAKARITEEDILEALRKDVHITSLDKIKEVYLERLGEISIVKE